SDLYGRSPAAPCACSISHICFFCTRDGGKVGLVEDTFTAHRREEETELPRGGRRRPCATRRRFCRDSRTLQPADRARDDRYQRRKGPTLAPEWRSADRYGGPPPPARGDYGGRGGQPQRSLAPLVEFIA